MPLKISVSGIRGIVGLDLNPPTIVSFVSAFLKILKKSPGKLLIGRDARGSGSFIQKLVEGTASGLGWHCVSTGIVPTPTLLYATRKLGYDGGMVITASHNPQQWNAMKFCDKRGLFLRAEQVQRVEALLQNDTTYDWKDHDSLGQSSHRDDTAALHVDHILSHIDADAIRKMGFRVVIDPCGSAGCSVDRVFLETLGCRVYGIHDHITDHFPRPPEPVPENLSLLGEEVRSRQAHIGFAQDPDADRLAVVSEQGNPIGEEYTVVLSGEAYLRRKKTNIAVNLSTSMMIDDLAARYNCTVSRTKIGEIHVTDTLIESGFDFGGEGNGGTIIPSINPCRDSLLAMGLILELMATEKRALSHILLDFPSYCMKKNKITLDQPTPQEFYRKMHMLSRDAFQGYACNQEDGIKIYNNEEWLHIRTSNTEPVVRIMAESPSNERSDKLIEMGNRLVISV